MDRVPLVLRFKCNFWLFKKKINPSVSYSWASFLRQKLGDPVLRPFLQVNNIHVVLFSGFVVMRKLIVYGLVQDVIQFGPLVKTLGLVMLTRPLILPSIFKQASIFLSFFLSCYIFTHALSIWDGILICRLGYPCFSTGPDTSWC